MKKKEILEVIIESFQFPALGVSTYNSRPLFIKRTIPGQKVLTKIKRKKEKGYEGILLSVIEKSPLETNGGCIHKEDCGGCLFQSISYEHEKSLKKKMVEDLLKDICPDKLPIHFIETYIKQYRNKMEYSFGDTGNPDELSLGLRKQGYNYVSVPVTGCNIVDSDFTSILDATLHHFKALQVPHYNKIKHTGILRYLMVRKGTNTGEIMVCLVTTSEYSFCPDDFLNMLKNLQYKGTLKSVIHVIYDGLSDAVKCDSMNVLYGDAYFTDIILGLSFNISPFSFFQTNTKGAETLYNKAVSMLSNIENKVVFDLYSGTGTITQILAKKAKKVIGVEIVAEAVDKSRENAILNGISNCEFIAGDVLKVLDTISDKPDVIVLDPPRDGLHHNALKKLLEYAVNEILYISCKPTSLKRDLIEFKACGYEVMDIAIVDMFPRTYHVECVVLMTHTGYNSRCF